MPLHLEHLNITKCKVFCCCLTSIDQYINYIDDRDKCSNNKFSR